MKIHNIAFGWALRDVRKNKGLTQETLAFECGRDRTYISLLELGQRSPTLDTIMILCRALDITLPQFAAAVQDRLDETAPGTHEACGELEQLAGRSDHWPLPHARLQVAVEVFVGLASGEYEGR